MRVPQPFPYQGSKRKLAGWILGYIPRDARMIREPFAGSAAVSIAISSVSPSMEFVLNDLNLPLMDLWQAILTAPEQLASDYQMLWDSQRGRQREFYNVVRTEFNRAPRPDLLLYLLARCVKASVRYNSRGHFNQSPDNRRDGMRPESMRRNLLWTSRCLSHRTRLTSVDYQVVLSEVLPHDVLYLDPPYQGVSGSRDQRYLCGLRYDEFVAALHDLNRRNISYLLSYDGRTGDKSYGRAMPEELRLNRIEIDAGPSTQATLLGGAANTYESLYLSQALMARLQATGSLASDDATGAEVQLSLFGE